MKNLEIENMLNYHGGDGVDQFCAGFGVVAATYGAGVWLNWWNPVGQTALGIGVLIGASCAVYALR
jgi:hypothetical protein